jgi:Protein of unknown function (DUF3054)
MSTDVVARSRSVVSSVVADAVALMVFVVAGIRSHHEVGALDLFLRNAVPLEVVWFAVSTVAATYRRPGIRTLLRTWVVAVPTGLIVRSIWVGSPSGSRLLVFVGIGMAFTLVFLLAGRGVAGLIDRRRRPADALPSAPGT